MSGAVRTFENRIEIRAPAKRVFEMIVDPVWLKESLPLVTSVEVVPAGPLRRGSRVVISLKDDDRVQPIKVDVDVTDFIASRVVEYAAFMAFRRGKDRTVSRYEVEQYGSVSRLVVKTSVMVETWLLRLTWPVVKWLSARGTDRQLAKLKARIESA